MKTITQSEDKTELHSVRSKKKSPFFKKPKMGKRKTKVTRSHSRNHLSSNQRDASDVEATMTNLQCPAKFAKCKYCGKQGHYIKMFLNKNHQRVHQIVTSPGYDGQEIYLGEDHTADDSNETKCILRNITF